MAVDFALLGIAEHALYLTSMNLNGLVVDLSTTKLFFMDYSFDANKKIQEIQDQKIATSNSFRI